jgi:hypothetical protein
VRFDISPENPFRGNPIPCQPGKMGSLSNIERLLTAKGKEDRNEAEENHETPKRRKLGKQVGTKEGASDRFLFSSFGFSFLRVFVIGFS